MAELTKDNLNQLAEMIKEGRKSAGSGIDSSLAGAAIDKFTAPLKAATKYVGDSIDTFSRLSETGNSFNNDIIGMKVAAANTRMSFDDFSIMMTKNNGEVGKSFAGLGGSVAKGGQAFTEFSKTFFDSGVAENLLQMGYRSKDLNEVLATQIGFQKSSTDTSVAGQIKTAAAAADLAMEMDLIAKQTGKTRKEQEAGLEKAKADGQIEAKMRLIGLTQGADAEKEARSGFAKQLAQAQAMGTDQIFKEMFATGTVRSQEAAMQMALLGQAARETANSAKALSKGNIEASQSAMESAKEGNLKNQTSVAQLQIAATGLGPAADVMKKNIETNDAAFQGASKTAKAMGIEMGEVTKILGAQKKAIQDEQQARHGATSAMIAAQARLQDATAAVANKVVAPLNAPGSKLDTAGLAVTEQLTQGVKAGDTTKKTTDIYKDALREQQQLGGKTNAPSSAREKIEATATKLGVDKAVQATDNLVGGALKGAGSMALKAANFIGDAMKVYQINKDKLETRDEGTLGKTGSAVEPADFIGKVAKGEMVLTPEQAKKFMEGAKTEGIADAVKNLGGMMPGGAKGSGSGGVNLSSISKEISTSISSVSGGGSTSINRVQNADSKKAQEELVALEQMQVAERKKLVTQLKEEGVIKGKHVNSGDYKNIPQLAALKEKQDGEQAVLSKRVDAGTSYETVREEAKAETIKMVTEQIAITKKSNSTLADMYRDDSKDKLATAKQNNEDLFKAAELAKDVVGTSVKGISDSMFESMIPKGTKIEDYYEDMNGKLQSYSVDTVAKLEKIAKEGADKTITEEKAIVETRVAIKKTEKAMTAAESLSIDSLPFKKSLQAKELPMTAGMPDMSKSIKEAELRLIGIQQGAEAEKNARKESAKLLTVATTGTTSGTTPITTGIDAKAIAPVAPKFDKSKFTMPTMDQLTIGPDGMPKISAKPQAQTIPAAVKPAEKPASPGKKINEETGEEYTPVGDAKKADKKTATLETKTTTLDDVAKLLTSLNTTMKQIASEASETNNRLGQQVKATKRMSGNLHGAS